MAAPIAVAIDIEAYEHGQHRLLEIGLAKLFPRGDGDAEEYIQCRHLVIQESAHLRNGDRVPDNRDNFRFGESELVSQSEASALVDRICRQSTKIVFHAARRDLQWLNLLGVGEDSLSDAEIVDTQVLAREVDAPLGLGSLAEYCGLRTECLHNAGNDSYYTLKVMKYLENEIMNEDDADAEYLAERIGDRLWLGHDDILEEQQRTEKRCPECDSSDHSHPTAECMGLYFTEWATIGNLGDGYWGDPYTYAQFR